MSTYEVNKVLWDVYRDRVTADAFAADPVASLSSRDLSERESVALTTRDLRWLVAAGAHPFLVYNFALRLAGQFSIPFVVGYVRQLQGLTIGDITT